MKRDARFRIKSSRLIHENFDDEVVIVDLDSGSYYSLNQSGADVWSLVARQAPLGEIIAEIGCRYQASLADIEGGLGEFLAELQREALVVPASDAAFVPVSEATGADITKSAFEAPRLTKYTDMQELLLLDPIHEADETGWPSNKTEAPGASG